MTIRNTGLYGGRPPAGHPAQPVPADYRSTAVDIDELREAARAAGRQADEEPDHITEIEHADDLYWWSCTCGEYGDEHEAEWMAVDNAKTHVADSTTEPTAEGDQR